MTVNGTPNDLPNVLPSISSTADLSLSNVT
jgi:hypothetical protein